MVEFVRKGRSCLLLVSAAFVLAGPRSIRAQDDPGAKPATAAPADASPNLPRYDVATIKPTADTDGMRRFMFTPAGISLTGVPIQLLLTEAFHVEDDHILGAPEWVKNKRWDVEAKVSPDDAPKLDKLQFDERRSMLLPLLVERFNLKYHHETREMASYSLLVAKGGPKMKASEVQPPPPDVKPPDAKPGEPAPPRPQQRRMLRFMGRGHLEAEASDTHMLPASFRNNWAAPSSTKPALPPATITPSIGRPMTRPRPCPAAPMAEPRTLRTAATRSARRSSLPCRSSWD